MFFHEHLYRMKQKFKPQQVAKESQHDINYRETLKFHVERGVQRMPGTARRSLAGDCLLSNAQL